uniref:Bridge-like lipid transfer protein family member 1 N-terminal domain-containing protein n=1 Tax=Ditylenchus dipsaci TaxID=166011 RepID=A0A915E988_9BILA
MNAFFKLQLQNFRAHCLVHKPLLTAEDKAGQTQGFCPVINIDQILIELKKDHTEALVQVMVGPSKLDFLEPDLSTQNSSISLGSCSLDSLQFRGHGLYSDLNVPWAVECMEYAWLVEVLVGEFMEKSLHKSYLPYSDLKIIDNKNRSQNCESSEALKYRLVRVSIDRLSLFIVDERSCAVQLEVENTRLSFCNAHLGSFAENLIVQLPKIEISQYISVHETRWLKCGAITIERTFGSPPSLQTKVRYMPEERRKFLQSHDKVSNRLYFLWRKNDKTCACFGDCRFFAKHDIFPAFIVEKVSHGITGVKLMRKDDPKKTLKSEHATTNSQLNLLKAEDWAKDPAAFYLRVNRRAVKSNSPCLFAQKAYQQCASSRHSQPLTASIIFRRQEKSFSPTSIRISLSVTTTNNPNEERKLSISTQHEARDKTDLGTFHLEVLQLIDSTKYDNVYNKVPVIATTNWRETGERDSSTTHVSRSISNLELRVDALNVTAVLGKSIESHSKIPQLKEEELSFFEVLTPLINSQISSTLKAVDEWKDLTFTKLLADALDWHDDQVLLPERTRLMEEVKLQSRNMNSCPSCKLILNLLHYVAQNGEAIYEHYSAAVNHCSNELRNKERRKMAIIALLSHWQTLICNEVQLADNILAQKYKYNANRRASSVLQSGHPDNNVVWQSSSSTKTEKLPQKMPRIIQLHNLQTLKMECLGY